MDFATNDESFRKIFKTMLTDDICRGTIYIVGRHIDQGGFAMKKSEPLSESYYYILLCLSKGANHGYGIMQMAEKLSGGEVKIGSGTMYGATSNMMKKGWIEETFAQEPGQERRRLYTLTDAGKATLENEIGRLKRMLAHVE